MNPATYPAELLFLFGTLATWIGAGLIFASLVKGIRLYIAAESERPSLIKSIRTSLIIGGVLMALAIALPMESGRPPGEGIRIPLVWLAMSFPAWLTLAFLFLMTASLIQASLGVGAPEKTEKYQSAAIWVGLALGAFLWHLSTGEKISVLRGAAHTSVWTILTVVVLALGAVMAMIASERFARSKGLAAKIATTFALVAGSVIFGIPFVWLLITSFKEERDMSMSDGMVWIPKVQKTYAFDDPERPLVLAKYKGMGVRATIIEIARGGNLLLEVERPYGIRGRRFEAPEAEIKRIKRDAPVVTAPYEKQTVTGFVTKELDDGSRQVSILEPSSLKGKEFIATAAEAEPVRNDGLRWENYTEAVEWMPLETQFGMQYLKNTVILVVMSVIGTLLSCSFVAYGFSRLNFPGKNLLFGVMLATMMLPGAVTMLPSFLIFRNLGWIDTLLPIWVPTFFAGAFNVFLLRQFFGTIPMELEDAAKIDGCSYLRTYWSVMLPLIRPALAAIAIWTFMGQWNNFMGPLIYISSPENMPVAYALQLFQSERGGSFGLMMAFASMATIPVLALFFLAQRWFIEGVQLSGLGGR